MRCRMFKLFFWQILSCGSDLKPIFLKPMNPFRTFHAEAQEQQEQVMEK